MKSNLQTRIAAELANVENLSPKYNTFDVASVIYGIRNLANLAKGLSEIYRILGKNCTLIILETSQPTKGLIRTFYLFYTRLLIPCIAKIFTENRNAYKYFSKSAINFPYGSELKKIVQNAGFKSVKSYPQFFGALTMYYAER